MVDKQPGGALPVRFPSTHWSQIAVAGDLAAPGARESLAELCQVYWYPLYLFIRRRGFPADESGDLVQDYFARLVSGASSEAPTAPKADLNVLDRRLQAIPVARTRRDRAQKRGGNRQIVSIDTRAADGRYLVEPGHDLTPERLYQRAWALTLLETVLSRLRSEYELAGNGAVFQTLKEVLSGGPDSISYASIASDLGTTEGAIQVAVHRLRKRYGFLLREQIQATLAEPAEVEDEIRELFAALAT